MEPIHIQDTLLQCDGWTNLLALQRERMEPAKLPLTVAASAIAEREQDEEDYDYLAPVAKRAGHWKSQSVTSSIESVSTCCSLGSEFSSSGLEPRFLKTPSLLPTASCARQTIEREVCEGGNIRIHWLVDARKLKSSDKTAVSPPFGLFSESLGSVRMMLCPTAFSDRKKGACFKRAKGKGCVRLKCDDLSEDALRSVITFWISIGSSSEDGARAEPSRGPVSHLFAESGVCGLPADEEEWDFSRAVHLASQTFVVSLEVLPMDSAFES